MTGQRRELMLRVIDGQAEAVPYVHFLDCAVHCDKFLRYLISARLTGLEFIALTKSYELQRATKQRRPSPLEFVRFMTSKIEREKQGRDIFYKRDII